MIDDSWIATKTQDVRIVDVVALGPFMIWFGATAKGMPEWAKLAMIVSGIATITYNAANMAARAQYDAAQDAAILADTDYTT